MSNVVLDNFKAKSITRFKEGHFIMIKWSVNLGNIKILNVYSPIKRASKYMKQNMIELQRDNRQSIIIFKYMDFSK